MTTFGTIQQALQTEQSLYVREQRTDDPRFERIEPDDTVRFFHCGRRAVRFTTDGTRHEVRCADIVVNPPEERCDGVYGNEIS